VTAILISSWMHYETKTKLRLPGYESFRDALGTT
jgi:hypothetical protein